MRVRRMSVRLVLRVGALVLLGCIVDPALPEITDIAAFHCGNTDCTQRGALFTGLPPQTGTFMVGVWFRDTQDVHWAIRWPGDSVRVDYPRMRDSSLAGAQLDGMPLNERIVLTVRLSGGARDSLVWDYR